MSQNDAIDISSEILRLINQNNEPGDIICDITAFISKSIGAKTVEVFQVDRRLNRFVLWSREGMGTRPEFIHRNDPLVSLAEREGRILTLKDWENLPVPEGRPTLLRDFVMILPLFLTAELVGLIALGHLSEDELTPEMRSSLESCRGPLSLFLELGRLRSLVIEDPVTGLRTHDYFNLRLNDEVERAHRYRRKVSLLMMRVDPLAKTLQGISPVAQERVLRQVGTILMENTRRSNVVARFVSDADVFQFMMPEIAVDVAKQQGEVLGRKISELAIEGLRAPLTVHFGAATFPDDAPSRQLLTAKAFSALNDAFKGRSQLAKPMEKKSAPRPDFMEGMDVRNSDVVAIFEMAFRIADSKSTVLIQGETGVGKEVLAEFIHRHSSRGKKDLVKVNCGALPETLVESELFGHEKGSFTGAEARRIGRFELANEGTIFLDEIGELTPMAQVKLLRIIEGKSFYRLGGTTAITSDVRIVAATNRDLLAEVQNGNFREDLYYRLNVVSFTLPPLRDRREDIPLLITRFVKQFNDENKTNIQLIHPEAMDILYRYNWPGNIRELKNAVERALILAGREGSLIPRYLPPSVLKGVTGESFDEDDSTSSSGSLSVSSGTSDLRFPDLNERQRQIIDYLRVHNYVSNQQYASLMKVSRRTCVRDFNELIDRRLIVREGKKKSCTYRLAEGI